MINLYYSSRKKLKLKIYLIITIIFTILSLSIFAIERKVLPTIQALGDMKAQELITKAVNQAVSDIISKKNNYNDLIVTREDDKGNIIFMQSNTMIMNKIATDVALTIQGSLHELPIQYQRIPLASIIGHKIFSHYGPKFKLKLSPLGVVDVDFGTEFKEAGINQTLHRVFLTINTKVRVIIPLSSNVIEVTNQVPVAETIIVGKVPLNYFHIPGNKSLD